MTIMRTTGLLLACVLIVTAGCTLLQAKKTPAPAPAPAPPTVLGSEPTPPPYLPPDRAVDKWDRCEKVHTYSADNLYLSLGREGARYKEYGFVELVQTKYRVGIEGTERLDVQVHHMRDNVAAFGIYSVTHDKNAEPVEVGARACATDLTVDMVKGPYFVRLNLDTAVAESRDSLVRFATYIAEKLPGDNALPALLSAFPEKDRVPHSEQYLAPGFLDRPYLKGGYRVLYETRGVRYTMFLCDGGDPDEAVMTMSLFRMSFQNVGSAEALLPRPWLRAFWALDPKLGRALVFQKGRYIGGTMGLPDRKPAILLSIELANALP